MIPDRRYLSQQYFDDTVQYRIFRTARWTTPFLDNDNASYTTLLSLWGCGLRLGAMIS
jgi:hypothetical protein